VVVASGATYRTLGLANGGNFDNSEIYYAATALEGDICRNQEVVVVGGGNSAGQAAVFLSARARHIHLLIRRESLVETMSDFLIGRILSSDRITLHPYTEIFELEGDLHLEGDMEEYLDGGPGKASHPACILDDWCPAKYRMAFPANSN